MENIQHKPPVGTITCSFLDDYLAKRKQRGQRFQLKMTSNNLPIKCSGVQRLGTVFGGNLLPEHPG
jgi:hypothetical protein